MRAALHGATFPKAQAIRSSMPPSTIREFATGLMASKPMMPAKAMRAKHERIHNLGKFAHKRKMT